MDAKDDEAWRQCQVCGARATVFVCRIETVKGSPDTQKKLESHFCDKHAPKPGLPKTSD